MHDLRGCPTFITLTPAGHKWKRAISLPLQKESAPQTPGAHLHIQPIFLLYLIILIDLCNKQDFQTDKRKSK